jgi:hypothetical protein
MSNVKTANREEISGILPPNAGALDETVHDCEIPVA